MWHGRDGRLRGPGIPINLTLGSERHIKRLEGNAKETQSGDFDERDSRVAAGHQEQLKTLFLNSGIWSAMPRLNPGRR